MSQPPGDGSEVRHANECWPPQRPLSRAKALQRTLARATDSHVTETLEERLRRLHRVRAPHLSWTDFQLKAGLSKDTLGALVRRHRARGTVEGGSIRTLTKLAEKYKAPSDWLISGKGDLEPDDPVELLLTENPGRWSERAARGARVLRDADPDSRRTGAEWAQILDALHGLRPTRQPARSYSPPAETSKIRSK